MGRHEGGTLKEEFFISKEEKEEGMSSFHLRDVIARTAKTILQPKGKPGYRQEQYSKDRGSERQKESDFYMLNFFPQ